MVLFNIAEVTFGNFLKILIPIFILMTILVVIKWLQSIKRKGGTEIRVVKSPGS